VRRAVITSVLCLTGALLAAPAAGTSRVAGWVITRTGRGGAVLTGQFDATARASTAVARLFALSGRGASRREDGAFTGGIIMWGVDGWPRAYGGLIPACPAACADPLATPVGYTFSSNGHPLDGTVYVASLDVDATVRVTSPGWRVRPWTPSIRTVTTESGGDAGVRVGREAVGRFTAAELAGGRYGSLAFAKIPCDWYGQGGARFTGGRHPWVLDCAGGLSAFGGRPGPVTWRLAGELVGVSYTVHVLVVVDYPAG
jgi:hypothetical protein